MRRTVLSISLLVASGAVLTLGQPVKAGEATTRDIVVSSAEKIKNDNDALRISVWADHEDSTYRIGEKAVFFFKTNVDAYVTLLNIGTSGTITVLFPNSWDKKNFVQGGKVYRLPPKSADYRFDMTGPPGTEVLKAIATLDAHDFSGRLPSAGDFRQVKGSGSDYLERDIKPVLDKKKKQDWAEYTKVIRTVEGRHRVDRDDRRRDRDDRRRRRGDRREHRSLNVEVWTDYPDYRPGDEVVFYVRANLDCYLTLLDFGTSGEVKILFPNRYDKKNHIQGGKTYRIPAKGAKEAYRVEGPRGTEIIRAIATLDDEPVYRGSYSYSDSDYQRWDSRSAERDIQVVHDRVKRRSRVAETVLEIEIE